MERNSQTNTKRVKQRENVLEHLVKTLFSSLHLNLNLIFDRVCCLLLKNFVYFYWGRVWICRLLVALLFRRRLVLILIFFGHNSFLCDFLVSRQQQQAHILSMNSTLTNKLGWSDSKTNQTHATLCVFRYTSTKQRKKTSSRKAQKAQKLKFRRNCYLMPKRVLRQFVAAAAVVISTFLYMCKNKCLVSGMFCACVHIFCCCCCCSFARVSLHFLAISFSNVVYRSSSPIALLPALVPSKNSIRLNKHIRYIQTYIAYTYVQKTQSRLLQFFADKKE